MDRTYFFFSCDNGYHLGQQRLPPGKREIFEHDINVALIVSGQYQLVLWLLLLPWLVPDFYSDSCRYLCQAHPVTTSRPFLSRRQHAQMFIYADVRYFNDVIASFRAGNRTGLHQERGKSKCKYARTPALFIFISTCDTDADADADTESQSPHAHTHTHSCIRTGTHTLSHTRSQFKQARRKAPSASQHAIGLLHLSIRC